MDDTPEHILARLQRHAESLRSGAAVRPPPRPDAPVGATSAVPTLLALAPRTRPTPIVDPPVKVVVWGQDRAADLLPAASGAAAPGFGVLKRTIAGQAAAVLSCIAALFAWMSLSASVAAGVIAGLALVAVIASARRVPIAGWCAIGLIIGLVLGWFS